MEDYPRSLRELESRFSTEEACREYSPAFVGPMARSVLVAEDPEAGRHPEVCGCVPAVVSKYR